MVVQGQHGLLKKKKKKSSTFPTSGFLYHYIKQLVFPHTSIPTFCCFKEIYSIFKVIIQSNKFFIHYVAHICNSPLLYSTPHSTAHLAGTLSASHSPASASMSCVFPLPHTYTHTPFLLHSVLRSSLFIVPFSSFTAYTYCAGLLVPS